MKLLAIDASNQVMSVAVLEDQKIIGEVTTNVKGNHSQRLMPAIHTLMKEVNWEPSALDRIVVAKGPGSYTGLRIGVTIAKTLAWTLDKEIVGVSSLAVLAGNCEESPNYLVPLFDARRGNIYTGLYQWQKRELVQIEADTHISAEKWAVFLSGLPGTFELIGEDRLLHQEIFEQHLSGRITEAPLKDHLPKAGVLGLLGITKVPEDAHTLVPDYLKLAEAEENWRKEHPDQLEETYVEKI
ncbi:tRNA (adenosine(37)-N6)-threonylcarbamoyltransferase complex dimerization subunit type 1 TsaB [Carnobacterium antarcticum]|uniref:tRNA (Adenosine(37)-N6)-threonylcarbamoyltransferase complex dimerization subunit type 1 TsaB n=1 Tax=Carnobacterium antarcticum TaxID=2126436 RepID=A0ABW4NPC1_9LACT|nr:tRNA (adenosine(37)-N6)-threonylcarbamoyltransferase complex dimerization subunit type 1 TsaB [Carnobacterium sp. CP1]ALV22681.1 TsaB protein, required [Carnobacterium sp. CP1]